MNVHTDTTAPAVSASDAAVARAMRNLEDDICALLNMARITGELLDSDLVGYVDGKAIHMPEPGKSMNVALGHDQMSYLMFACNDVIRRAKQLEIKFYAAWDKGAAA